ncbi:Glutathione S-transferase theta-2B [Frankliniella fusca]|uniref:Glutathione S-transferase theta-2B n=1 Tax=Frankliniella fusca TaxID=407009 RepID=A0AAE1HVT1_9NEOP|nr:Glutathione S-transferase theta-2B [Frankliniella fusca]
MALPCSECCIKLVKDIHVNKHVKGKHGIPYQSDVVEPPTEILTPDCDKAESSTTCDVPLNFNDDSDASMLCDMPVQSNEEINFTDLLVKQEDILVAKLYANPAFPRNLVDKIVKDFSDYFSNPFFENCRDTVTSSLDPALPSDTRKKIESIFETLHKPFEHLQTEYKRLKYFESCGDYIPPESYQIFAREERVKTKGGVTLQMKEVISAQAKITMSITMATACHGHCPWAKRPL